MKKPEVLFRVIISFLLLMSILEIIILNIKFNQQSSNLEDLIEKEKQAQVNSIRIESVNKDYLSQINNLKKEIKEIANRNEELTFIFKKLTDKLDYKVDESKVNNVIDQPIAAKIIASIPEQNLVMLSVGKAEKVKVGYKFTVFRQNDYLGKVEIIEVHPNMSAGRVIEELKNSKGLKIERGDDAKTGL